MGRKYKVKFTAAYEAIVEVNDGQTLADAVSDIDIPGNYQCHYVANSFDPSDVAVDLETGEVRHL